MGKFDHILELTGPETYFAWKREVTYALGTEDLWCHVSSSIDPTDILGVASFLPVAVDPANPSADEVKAIRLWLVDDLKAKAIITRHLSVSVQQFISDSHKVTAHAAWKILGDHYGRTDISSQYIIQNSIGVLQMKDTVDTSNYITHHSALRERLNRM